MGKSPWDLAAVLAVIAKPSYPVNWLAAVAAKRPLSDFRVGVVRDGFPCTKDFDPTNHALVAECGTWYDNIIERLGVSVDPVVCPALEELVKPHGLFGWDENGKWKGCPHDLGCAGDQAASMKEYLAGHQPGGLRTVEDLVKWNNANPASSGSRLS
jgi:hypothetical protein